MARQTFDVTYRSVDIEILPAHLVGAWPAESYRLVVGNYVPAVVMVSTALLYYFVLVSRVFPATKPTTPKAIARCRQRRSSHNVALSLYSGFCCVAAAIVLHSKGELFNWHALLCSPVEGTILRPLSVTFTLSKLVEWWDTAYLMWLGRSEPVFLHLYHHATTFWLFCFVMNLPGPEKLGLLLNGAVHCVMYWHYYAPWPKAVVPLITLAQIVQLTFVTYAYYVSVGECPSADFVQGSTDHPWTYYSPCSMVPVYLFFFIVFFVNRFLIRVPKKTIGATMMTKKLT